jgi:imidazoleglycerol phosphate dehydratase HisB
MAAKSGRRRRRPSVRPKSPQDQRNRHFVSVDLDGTGKARHRHRHRLSRPHARPAARHSLIDITLKRQGRPAHRFPPHGRGCGIALGQAVAKALGDKKGIRRYASSDLPMDGTLTRVAIDVSGRPFLVWKVEFTRDKVGEMDTELFREWFQAFAMNAGITLHVENLLRRQQPPHRREQPSRRWPAPCGRPGNRRHHRLRLGQPASAAKAFERAARETGTGNDHRHRARPTRCARPTASCCPASVPSPIAAPGSMPSPAWSRCCSSGDRGGVPFLGICVGMQLMATRRPREDHHQGLGWIPGDVVRIEPE